MREADGNPTNPGWHFLNMGGDMNPGGAPPGGAPPGGGGAPPGGGGGGGPPPGAPPPGPPPPRRRLKKLPRDPKKPPDAELTQEDADAYARIGSPPPGAPAPPVAPPDAALEADLFGDDDEVVQERPLRDGSGVPASPPTEEEEAFAQDALAEAALAEPLTFSPSPSSAPASPPPAGIPAAGNVDVNPLVGPDPTIPVVDDVEEFRQLLPTLAPEQVAEILRRLVKPDADGMYDFVDKKISKALRDQIVAIAREAGDQLESSMAASSSGVAAPADEVFAFRVRLAQQTPREIERVQQELRNAEELPNGMLRYGGKTISPATRKEFMRMAREELESRVTVYKGSGIVVRSDQIRR